MSQITSKINSNNVAIWTIYSASKCAILKPQLFEMLVLNAVLGNFTEKPQFWKSASIFLWRVTSILLWVVLILVILSSIGRELAFGDSISVPTPKIVTVESVKSIHQIKEKNIKIDLDTALYESREIALKVASQDLDLWKSNIMKKVDDPKNNNDFLDWYFGYWTQQEFGIDGVKSWINHRFDKNSPTAKEKIQETVSQEFAHRVLRPEIAKLEIKNIGRNISQVYSNELQKNLGKIRIRYDVPQAEWNSYLETLTVLITDFSGRQVSQNVKAITIGGMGGGAVIAKGSLLAFEKVTAKIGAKAVSKAAASITAKVSAFTGSEFLGPAATVAVLLWDAYDIHKTEIENRPILKQNIEKYFDEMTKDILKDEQHGIQKVILDLESNIKNGITASHFPFLPL